MNPRIALILGLVATFPARGQTIQTSVEVRILETADTRVNRQAIRRDAIPSVTVGVEAKGPGASFAAIEADGLLMDVAANTNGATPFRASLQWWPWHGNGTYTLVARAQGAPASAEAARSHALHAEIGGLYYRTPSPLDQIVRLYRDRFNLRLARPPLVRFISKDRGKSCWISAAYVEDTLYELRLYDDLHDVSRARPVNRTDARGTESPVTRPAGHYSMLVVFLDHGNTQISESDARRALTHAADLANDRFARMSARAGSKAPLLSLDVAGAVAPWKGGTNVTLLQPQQIQALTGKDPSMYQLLAQVDLDASTPAGGHAVRGYDGHPGSGINLWARIPSLQQLDNVLARILLGHELNHTFGWQHEWACGLGGYDDNRPGADPLDAPIPALLFGWTDLDQDDIPEILDLTPYGLTR